MYRLLMVIVLIFWMSSESFAQVFEVSEKELDTNYINAQIYLLSGNTDVKDYVYKLEKLKYVSEKLKFHSGVKRSTALLLNYLEKKDDADTRLRVALQYQNYLTGNELYRELVASHEYVGDIYLKFRLFAKAAESYSEAIAVADAKKLHYRDYTLYKKRGAAFKENGDLEAAKNDLERFAGLARKKQIVLDFIWAQQRLSDISKSQGQFEEMVKRNKEIIDFARSNKLERQRIIALNNLGYAYKYTKKYAEAEQLLLDVIDEQGASDKVKSAVYQNLGILAQNQAKFEKSREYLKKAAALYSKSNDVREEAMVFDFIALTYYQEGDFYNALEYNKKCFSLVKQYDLPEVKQSALYTKSLIYQGLYEFEPALDYFKEYLLIKDSLEKEEFKRQQGILQQQYYLERQENELQLTYISEELKDLEIAKLKAEAEALIDRAEAEAERSKALKADSLLKQEQIVTQMLRIREIENMLKLKDEQEKARERENKIALLHEQDEKNRLALENEKLLRDQENRAAQQKLEQEAAFNRNLTYVLAGLLLMLLIIIVAYRQVRKKKKQIASQKVIIEEERDKSDKLLLNILPPKVAGELKEKGQTSPHFYEEASIVFTDFVGFTSIAEKLTPVELVQTLDKIFLEFDLIIEKYHMSRIKTIGDAYMCVSGLPETDPEHAKNAVMAAIEMRDFVMKFNDNLAQGEPTWNIRVGVNSGPLIAGVVGVRKFAYDVWGDAVNIASRMESSGAVNKVNISQSTHELTKGMFDVEYRGKIEAKNKGQIDMYFVESLPI